MRLESNNSERGGWGEHPWAAPGARWARAVGRRNCGQPGHGGFSPKLPQDSKLRPHLRLNMKCMQEKSSAGRCGGEEIRGIF